MKRCGIVVDIGTTTVTVGLIDVALKKEIASLVDFNPQAEFGQDIVSRLSYSLKHKDGLQKLHNAIIKCINGLVEKLLKEKGLKKSDLRKTIVAGNTVMEHFFLKISAEKLCEAPYVSDLPRGVIEFKNVYLLPIIKSFVGSDLTAGILYTKLGTPLGDTSLRGVPIGLSRKGARLLVDIGTNGEMALNYKGKLFVTSTAAGPAFEISDKGILGSEIIEIVASMLKNGIIDKTGKLLGGDRHQKRCLSPCALITQSDIRRIQVAKAAITAGMHVLLKKAGIGFKDLSVLYVAGKFGNFINKQAAIDIGLLPDINPQKIKFIGNAAYKGAILALCSGNELKKTEKIAEKAIHLSLFGRKDFQEEFVRNMSF